MKKIKKMSRSFRIESGKLNQEERLALSRLVNKILSEIERYPGQEIEEAMRGHDCSAFSHRSWGEPWVSAFGSKESGFAGFYLVGDYWDDEGQWCMLDICKVSIPALAKLTRC